MNPTYKTFPDLPTAEAALAEEIEAAKAGFSKHIYLILDAHYTNCGLRRAAIIQDPERGEILLDLVEAKGETEVTLRCRPVEGIGDIVRELLMKGHSHDIH